MSDISEAEIERWLASVDSDEADIASRVYIAARRAHVTGEKPKWCRLPWHDLPKDYRDFLTSFVLGGRGR